MSASAESRLAPSALAELQRVYDRYMNAQLGELNKTADDLRDTCVMLQWNFNFTRLGYLEWARGELGFDRNGLRKSP